MFHWDGGRGISSPPDPRRSFSGLCLPIHPWNVGPEPTVDLDASDTSGVSKPRLSTLVPDTGFRKLREISINPALEPFGGGNRAAGKPDQTPLSYWLVWYVMAIMRWQLVCVAQVNLITCTCALPSLTLSKGERNPSILSYFHILSCTQYSYIIVTKDNPMATLSLLTQKAANPLLPPSPYPPSLNPFIRSSETPVTPASARTSDSLHQLAFWNSRCLQPFRVSTRIYTSSTTRRYERNRLSSRLAVLSNSTALDDVTVVSEKFDSGLPIRFPFPIPFLSSIPFSFFLFWCPCHPLIFIHNPDAHALPSRSHTFLGWQLFRSPNHRIPI